MLRQTRLRQQTKATPQRRGCGGTKSSSDPQPPAAHRRYCPDSPTMLDTISSQYDSFIYWRMPIPRLELAELEGLGLGQGSLYAPHSKLPEAAQEPGCAEEDSLLPFSSFNFWRAPIASISSFDFDLI